MIKFESKMRQILLILVFVRNYCTMKTNIYITNKFISLKQFEVLLVGKKFLESLTILDVLKDENPT